MDDHFESENSELPGLDIESNQPITNEELLRRLIRLVVGLALISQDALRQELPKWEAEAAKRIAEIEQTGKFNSETASNAAGKTERQAETLSPWFPTSWEYRLVGLAFASPRYLHSAVSSLLKAPKKVWRATAPLRLPLDYLGITGYSRDWLESVVDKIRDDLDELEEIGRQESVPSRSLGYVAVLRTYELFFHYLSENPEVQDLIQQQSVGLTTEMVGEVRQRAVSLDMATDAIMRRLLHLGPTQPSPHAPNQASEDEKRDPSW